MRCKPQGKADLNSRQTHRRLLKPLQGLVHLVDRKAYTFEGPNGDSVVEGPVPESMAADVEHYRNMLVEAVRRCAGLLVAAASRNPCHGSDRVWRVAHDRARLTGWMHELGLVL